MKVATRRSLSSFVVLAVLAETEGVAFADNSYIGIEGGLNSVKSQSATQGSTGLNGLTLNKGYAAGLTFDYSFSNGFRPEFELAFRNNKISSGQASGSSSGGGLLGGLLGGGSSSGSSAAANGSERAVTGMLNLWYDLTAESGIFHSLHPYIGGGGGFGGVSLHSLAVNGATVGGASDSVFAYQAGAGIGYDISRRFRLSLDYRYLRTSNATLNNGPNGNGDAVDLKYKAQTVFLSAKFALGAEPEPAVALPEEPVQVVPVVAEEAPPPPPPPAPAPAAAPCQLPPPGQPITLAGCNTGDVLVLHGVNFEFNKMALTVNAKSLLDQVADALKERKDIKVEVDGHTDGKGTAAYNLKLSRARAESVKQYLITRGIDADRLATKGFGKSRPIADNNTDEGRELNRRVELRVIDAADVGSAVVPSGDAASVPVVVAPVAADANASPADNQPSPGAEPASAPSSSEASPASAASSPVPSDGSATAPAGESSTPTPSPSDGTKAGPGDGSSTNSETPPAAAVSAQPSDGGAPTAPDAGYSSAAPAGSSDTAPASPDHTDAQPVDSGSSSGGVP